MDNSKDSYILYLCAVLVVIFGQWQAWIILCKNLLLLPITSHLSYHSHLWHLEHNMNQLNVRHILISVYKGITIKNVQFLFFISAMKLSQLPQWHLHNIKQNCLCQSMTNDIFSYTVIHHFITFCVSVWPIIFTCTMTCAVYKMKIKTKINNCFVCHW